MHMLTTIITAIFQVFLAERVSLLFIIHYEAAKGSKLLTCCISIHWSVYRWYICVQQFV